MGGSCSDTNRLTLDSLQRRIASAAVTFTLWHCSQRLAHVTTRMSDLTNVGRRAPILMQPSYCFPGSIAPCLEARASVELVTSCNCCGGQAAVSAVSTNADAEKSDRPKRCDVEHCRSESASGASVHGCTCALPMRQRPVCHGRPTKSTTTTTASSAKNGWQNNAALSNVVDFVCARCQSACSTHSSPPQTAKPATETSDFSLWLQSVHPTNCAICAEYREYFGDVYVPSC